MRENWQQFELCNSHILYITRYLYLMIFTHKESRTKKGFGYYTVLRNLLKWMLQTLKSFITCVEHYKERTIRPYCYKANKV